MPDLNDQQHDHFLRLFAEHEPAVRTFVRTLLPARDGASEVMQEVAVVLWQKFAEFDASRDFRKWAFGVARYEVLTYLRDKLRDRHVFDDALVNRLADDAAAAEPRHDAQREVLEACLQKLPPAQRGQTPMSLYKVLHRVRQALLECVRRQLAMEGLQ
jgi:RNA polymerase sigma-70 factor, ECF subfamily